MVSIQLHPNYVDRLYEEITKIYVDISKQDLSLLFIDLALSKLSSSNKEKLQKEVKAFQESKENFEFKAENFHPRNCYTFESSLFRGQLEEMFLEKDIDEGF